MPTLGYSARDREASLRNVSIKDMQWGWGAAQWPFLCEALNSIPNMVGCGA